MEYHHFLVQHLAVIDQLVRFVARRHHLSAADAEEFASLVTFKLVDRDFAVLRKFEGRSSITTYLTVVIERMCLDFCIARWGKWRPSATARRLGAVAILLEQLVVRERITFDEAVGTLQTNHGVGETRAELHALFLKLPVAHRHYPHAHPPDLSCGEGHAADASIAHRDARHLLERVQTALMEAFSALTPEDQHIVRLRFEEGLAVADIARALNLEAKPLYRRLEFIIRDLRSALLRQGIEEHEISCVIGHPTFALSGVLVQHGGL